MRIVVGLLAAFFLACAPPAPRWADQSFVPREELAVASLYREAEYYFGRSRFVDAELKLRQALYLQPDLVNLQLTLAAVLGQQGIAEEAEQIYRRQLEEEPKTHEAIIGLAALYYNVREYKKAAETYSLVLQKALEQGEFAHAATVARDLAIVFFHAGDEGSARCFSALALNIEGTPDQVVRHGRLLLASGDLKGAEELFSSSFERQERADALGLYVFSLTRLGLEQFSESRELSQLALDRVRDELGLELQIRVLSKVLDRVIFAEDREIEKFELEEELEEKGGEESISLEGGVLEDYLERAPLNSPAALYWPLNLLYFFEKELSDGE